AVAAVAVVRQLVERIVSARALQGATRGRERVIADHTQVPDRRPFVLHPLPSKSCGIPRRVSRALCTRRAAIDPGPLARRRVRRATARLTGPVPQLLMAAAPRLARPPHALGAASPALPIADSIVRVAGRTQLRRRVSSEPRRLPWPGKRRTRQAGRRREA